MHGNNIIKAGKPVEEAEKVLIMIHGRGGSAEDILSLSSYLNVDKYALLAPQATQHTWYPHSFLMPTDQNEPGLSSALQWLAAIEQGLIDQGFASENIYFLGFSQGACLSLEYSSRHAKKYGGVIALTGGLIGDKLNAEKYHGDFEQTPVFIGSSDPDPHIPVDRVHASAEIIRDMHADVTVKIYKDRGHVISQQEIDLANTLIFV
ncbi:phospholipase/carboxylesterase [Catalinimonas alkaloidigena]|uniref:alpha/beta hydrolase n=1 Tax=Catalinimonas alkaloidigena TaxID=1075417 RepID=UPI0024066FA1|nr:dienelactone hydrolase family protein [Catalinimonas alkaloidigena]MDF9798069.1 phospholipase/carboxylesterase [Catalinimonas alkaloidigena]